MTSEELKAALIAKGFKISNNGLASQDNAIKWYAWKFPIETRHECECNQKPQQIVIQPHDYTFRNGSQSLSCQCVITGELGGHWFELKSYSLPFDVIVRDIDMIRDDLIAAWDAIGDKVQARKVTS